MTFDCIIVSRNDRGLVVVPTWSATEQLAYVERMREKAAEHRRLADSYDALANGASERVTVVGELVDA